MLSQHLLKSPQDFLSFKMLFSFFFFFFFLFFYAKGKVKSSNIEKKSKELKEKIVFTKTYIFHRSI